MSGRVPMGAGSTVHLLTIVPAGVREAEGESAVSENWGDTAKIPVLQGSADTENPWP